MKAVIGQFYKTKQLALKRAEAMKRLWKGKIAFVVIGNQKGFLVISETSARACGIDVSYKERKYKT